MTAPLERRQFVAMALSLAVLGWAAPAWAGAHPLAVPAQVIYPGDKITDAMLADSDDAAQPPQGAFLTRADLVGKVARRTLLPGRPIPAFAVEEPRAVSVGSLVSVHYEQDGLSIVTTAQALQNGYVGQVVQARNIDSGVVITGIVEADGSIRIQGG
ncbi:MAG TPA: flagellar basal body P-ring formation chaperone FlgA [Rhodoblastus sp.]|nr:flagellar basal body P-ring formation chaperone FlgA [Rhodoblastus sp.]